MHVGICQVTLYLPDNHSLKGKRKVIKSLIERLKNRFNVAVAETGGQDEWQRAVLSLCLVANDGSFVNQGLDKILDFIEADGRLDVGEASLEILAFHDQ
ncbi:MAG: DUF503 domain-containing protein [Deltaproteobacteria bacterium]|jgi:uncharacterized protein YlxP (DUF503 family)|nr:DUF503 domain-containing protein [Deltaproteobacteria bacterium]